MHDTIMGLGVFHFRVRNGNGWSNTSITTKLLLLMSNMYSEEI
jgi:hypothetical protein